MWEDRVNMFTNCLGNGCISIVYVPYTVAPRYLNCSISYHPLTGGGGDALFSPMPHQLGLYMDTNVLVLSCVHVTIDVVSMYTLEYVGVCG